MNLSKIAKTIYDNVNEIIIKKDIYTDEIFTQNWLIDEAERNLKNVEGWYWIKTDLDFEYLSKLHPENQRKKGSLFYKTAGNNKKIFHEELINKTYFYNGHAKKIVSRLRNHFYLQNDGTGALGINAYPILQNHTITVRYFTTEMIDNLKIPEIDKSVIRNLILKNIGRTAIENAWRAENGFPILCKH
ncbi:hypothetical protein [Tenacibaculum aestuarii]|uniref:hypothetical protein n=1 Tax=Tenacibaculum aestuarii TaxID=362781 RepID=UPI0038950898